MSDYSIRNRTVIAATATGGQVTLYFKEGDTMTLPSNQEFTKQVIDAITPALAKGQSITLNMDHKTLDIFSKYQEKTGGLVKFFRVMKKALTGKEVTSELLASIALPLDSVDLEDENETVVAVVTNSGETVYVDEEELEAAAAIYDKMVDLRDKPKKDNPQTNIIVGAEKLATQVKHFTNQDDRGFRLFLERMGRVAAKREHTSQELLDFLKKNDLPIASDGCIVAYKRLSVQDRDRGIFVDSYSKKVTQRVGTKVFMKAEMVDPNRRNHCSNGLHVGRRDYMSSFYGDTIVLVKIRPEDVIAVPQDYSGAKMRCCAYTIVAEVDGEALKRLAQSQDMTTVPTAAQMLTRVLSGDHTPTTDTVEITGSFGSNLVVRYVQQDDWHPQTLAEVVDRERAPTKTATETAESSTPVTEETEVEGTKALEEVNSMEQLVDPAENSPEVIKRKAMEAVVDQAEAGGAMGPAMTEQQKLAKSKWAEVKAGTLSKSQLARDCGTSARSLDRWADKFNF